jgi:hypothetical protein
LLRCNNDNGNSMFSEYKVIYSSFGALKEG